MRNGLTQALCHALHPSVSSRHALLQVYVWGRRHPYVHLNFLGLFNFTAPYLPWVLLAFSVTLRSNAVVDLLGIVAGVPLSHSVSYLMLRPPFLQVISAAVTPGKVS